MDVWSFGLVLGEMGLLSPLVPGEDTGDQIGQVVSRLSSLVSPGKDMTREDQLEGYSSARGGQRGPNRTGSFEVGIQ